MNIIFMRSNPINPDSRVEKEVNSLLKDGHQITILGWNRERNHKVTDELLELPNGNARILRFGSIATYGGGFKKNIFALIKVQVRYLLWLIRNSKSYDIIHACDFDNAYTARLINFLCRKPYVYDIFDYYVDSHNFSTRARRYIEKLDKRIISKSLSTIICSEKRIAQLDNSTPNEVLVIHNSPSTEIMNFNSDNFILHGNSNKIKIAYVGILSKRRMILELIDFVKENNDTIELHIGGFGQLEEEVTNSAKNFKNIFWYGKIPYSHTLSLEKACDIITALYDPIINNHRYAAPNKFYEALFLGKPLIMAFDTGMDQVVSEYRIGEVIEFNKKALEIGILKLIDNKDKWPEMAKKMKALFEKQYSWEIMENRLQNMYKNIETSLYK